MTVEEVFGLLADAAGVRHPNPEKENRGLCPAHQDTHNPGLTFRIADSGKLVTHCFSQDCTAEDIADSIGVPVGAFFPDGGRGRVRPPAEYVEPSLLDLLKLVPLGMSFEEQERAVFRCLELAYESGVMENGDIDIDQPMRSLPLSGVMSYIGRWLSEAYTPDKGDWRDLADGMLTRMRQLNRQHRKHTLAQQPAIPRRDTR